MTRGLAKWRVDLLICKPLTFQDTPRAKMNRRLLIGLCGILLLGTYFIPINDTGMEFARAAAIKAGFVLIALWAAYPDLQRIPTWLVLIVGASVVLVLWRPVFAVFIVPALFALWLLRPRDRPS